MLSLLLATALAGTLPSIDEPHRTKASAEGDAAVVIGLEDYAFIADVPYAKRDAQSFYDLLLYTRGVPAEKMHLLTAGGREQILAALEQAGTEVGPGGTVWVYFAGHGAASATDGARMLLGDDVRADPTAFDARGVRIGEVEQAVSAGGGSPMLVLDTCYAGQGRGGDELAGGTRFAVPSYAASSEGASQWTAAGPNELSAPLDAAEHGAFTYFVVGALRGWADGELDGERDGSVSAGEAQAYVSRALRSVQQRTQTPTWVGGQPDALTKGTEEPPELRSIEQGTAASGETIYTGSPDVAQARASWPELWEAAKVGGTIHTQVLDAFIERYGELRVAVAGIADAAPLTEALMAKDWRNHSDPTHPKVVAMMKTPGAYEKAMNKDVTQSSVERTVERRRSQSQDFYAHMGASLGGVVPVVGNLDGAADVSVTGSGLLSVHNHGPFVGLEGQISASKAAGLGTRLILGPKISTGGEQSQIAAGVGAGYATGEGLTGNLVIRESIEGWWQSDDSDSWFAVGPRLELQHYLASEATVIFLGVSGNYGAGDSY